MKGIPVSGPSPRRTDTRASVILLGLMTFFVPSEWNSASSCIRKQSMSERNTWGFR